jgi:hypothetical protein
MKKLSLDDLVVDSFETLDPPAQRGTVMGHDTWGFDCQPENTMEYPCTWEPQLMCTTNEIAYPTECTGCGVICNQTADHCPSNMVWC